MTRKSLKISRFSCFPAAKSARKAGDPVRIDRVPAWMARPPGRNARISGRLAGTPVRLARSCLRLAIAGLQSAKSHQQTTRTGQPQRLVVLQAAIAGTRTEISARPKGRAGQGRPR